MTLIELLIPIVFISLGVLAGWVLNWLTDLNLYASISLSVILSYSSLLLLQYHINRKLSK